MFDRLTSTHVDQPGDVAVGGECLFSFPFVSKTVLVIGNERLGIDPEVLERLDRVAEIQMAGLPHSLNAATSTAVAIYEYCRQFPSGTLKTQTGAHS